LNEGHAAFAVLERARSFMQETGQSFEVRWPPLERETSSPLTRRWPPVLIVSLRPSSSNTSVVMPKEKLGISLHDLLAMGRQNPNDSSESFNMAYLAIRGAGR
jgi:starch phosphorylase